MDHSEAIRIKAPERYVIGELTPPQAEAFEEHFFCCPNCAEEVILENAFAENAKAVFADQLRAAPYSVAEAADAEPGWWERLRTDWALAFMAPLAATACLLAVVLFQNLSTIPRLRTEVAQVTSGEAPFAFPLKLARGNEAITVPHTAFLFMPYFFLPGGVASAHYICDIETADGVRKKHLTVSAPPAGQPLSLLLLRSEFPSGTYRLKVRSENAPDPIATYTMDLSAN